MKLDGGSLAESTPLQEPNLALIFGCARSGTSILGEVFAASEEVSYVFEASHVWERAGLGENDSHRLTELHARPEIAESIRSWFLEQQNGRPLVVEKCPRNTLRVPFLRSIFPEVRLIHIVRDGRDVACSLMPGIGREGWMHLKPPSWKRFRDQEAGIRRCALVWQETVEIALDDLEGVPHFLVRFEDLVARPLETMRRLVDSLGIKLSTPMRAHLERIQDATADSYHAEHQVHWYRANHERRVGRWRDNLTLRQQTEITEILAPTLERLGYEL